MNFFKKQHSQNSQQSKGSTPSNQPSHHSHQSGVPMPAPGMAPNPNTLVPQFVGGSYDMEEQEQEEGEEEEDEGSYYDEDDDFLAAHESGIPHPNDGMPPPNQVYPPVYPPAQYPPAGPYDEPQYPRQGPPGYVDPYGDDRSYSGYPPPAPMPMGGGYSVDPIMHDPMYPPNMNPYGPGYGAPVPPPVPGYGGGDNEITMYLSQGYSFDEAVAMAAGGVANNPYMADMSMYGGVPPPGGAPYYGGSSAYGAPGYAPPPAAGGGYGRSNYDGNEEDFQAALRRSLEEERERQARVNATQRDAMESVERANEKALQIALQRSFEEFEEQQRVRTSMPNVDPYAVDRANDEAFEAARLASLRESLPPPPPVNAAQYPMGGVVAKTLVRVGGDQYKVQNGSRGGPVGGDQRIASQAQPQYSQQQGYPQQGYNNQQMPSQVYAPIQQGSGLLAIRHHPGAPSPSPSMTHQSSNNQGSGLLTLRSRSIDNNDPAGSPTMNPNPRSGSGLLGLRSRSNDHGDNFSPVPRGMQPVERSDSFEDNQASPAPRGGAQQSSGLLAYRKQHPNSGKTRSSNNSVNSDSDKRSAAMRVAQAAVRSDHKPNPLGQPRMSIHRMNDGHANTQREPAHVDVPGHDDDEGSYESSDEEEAAPRQSQGKQGSVVANTIMQKRTNPLGNPRMSIHRMTDESSQPAPAPVASTRPRLTPSISNRPVPSADDGSPALQPNPNNPLFKGKR